MTELYFQRHRRLRQTPAMRALVKETYLHKEDLIYPLFIIEGDNIKNEVSSMPGVFQLSLDNLAAEVDEIVDLGIRAVLLFGIPAEKDAVGSGAYHNHGIVQQATRLIKERHPELLVIADTCLCEFTDHGHCGVVENEQILNDPSLNLLAQTAISQAEAGADIIAPSNMMDGFVTAIRAGLDAAGFEHIPVMSYAVKYASSYYGPFREAAEGAPKFGDRKTYQMDPSNRMEAIREATSDVEEGADFLIVKPALAYMDIIRDVKNNFALPVVAYNVSGEYSMVKAAAQNGWIDEKSVVMETLIGMKRAGSDLIITYHAKDVCRWLGKNKMRSYEKSKAAFAEAIDLMPGGVNSPVRAFKSVNLDPIFMESGKGAIITDIDGNEYIDYVLSWGPLILGHSEPKVVQAIQQQAAKATSFGAPSLSENELAKLVMDRVPGIEMIRFVSSGTEATMSALRLARGVTGRDKILKFEGSYHGHGDSLLIKAGSGVATLGLPDSPGVPADIAKNTLTVPYNDLEATKIVFEKFGSELAAVIVEPVAGNMGVVPPKPEFLTGLRELTEQNGTILIFDEVMTGFRVDYGCAQGHYGVTPDLTTLGKVIGGGLPVGAFAGKREIMEQIAPAGPIYQAGTLSGNPLAMTAGYATLSQLTPASYDYFKKLGDQLEEGFRAAATKFNIPHTVNRAGSMIGFFFTNEDVVDFESAKTSDLALFAEYFKLMAEEGIFLPPSQFEGLFISTAHTEAHIAKTVAAFHSVFEKLAR